MPTVQPCPSSAQKLELPDQENKVLRCDFLWDRLAISNQYVCWVSCFYPTYVIFYLSGRAALSQELKFLAGYEAY